MADKTPVRVVFNSSNVATGMAEFQSGETVPVANGGTGLGAIGSAGQIIKVNAAGNALEFGAEGDISITNLVAPTNADLTLTTSGTGGIILNDISISDNAISTNRTNDDFKINASGTGTVNLENLKVGTGGATVTTILDEDAMGSDSATSLATQQSIKAYVDAQDAAIASDTLTLTNKTFDAEGTGNSLSNVDVANLKSGVLDTDISSVAETDTTLASAKAIKAYADTKAVLSGSTNNQITTVTGAHAMQGESNLTFDGSTLAVTGAVTVSGDLTVSGDTTTVSTTNTAISDNILELNTGISQSFNDAGIIIERGSTGNNAAIIWDESADTFVLGTTTATAGDKSGGITIDAGSLKIASLEVDGVTITDNVITSNSSNADLEINANGSGSVVIGQVSTNSVTGEVIPGKVGGTNFARSILIGHSTTGTLDSAEDNLGIGDNALNSVTSGDQNICIGSNTGTAITTATANVYIGRNSGSGNATGSSNFGLGVDCLEDASFTGTSNVAIGRSAGAQMESGNFNILIGQSAGDNITTGHGNLIMGANVDADSVTGSRQLKIAGYDGTTTTTWITGDSSGNLTTVGDVTLANNKKVIFGDAGESISGDGTDMTITGNIVKIDAASRIILDAAENRIDLADNGSEFGRFVNNGGQLRIQTGSGAAVAVSFDSSGGATFGQNVAVTGDLTVSGNTTTVSTTNTTIADNIIELNTGISQSSNDAGIIIERGSTGNNAAIIWDESADTFVLGTTTATAADKSGGITIDAGSLKIASLEADGVTITDNTITSNSSNSDLEINANGSGSVVIGQVSTNSVTGEVIPGKVGGTNFTDSLLIGHATTGTLNSAERNLGILTSSLEKVTSGDDNIAIGKNTLRGLTAGAQNVALGNFASAHSSTGLASYTTFVGYGAGGSNQGSYNTAVGRGSLQNVTGNYNIGLGVQVGDNITSGAGNVMIGHYVDADSATGDRQLKIVGYDGTDTTTWLTGDSSGNLTTTGDITLANDKKVIFGDAGENISGDGTNLYIVSSNALGFDVANGITLDSGSGGTILKAGGSTTYGTLTSSSGNLSINQTTSDKDIIFTGNDGGSTIEAMRIDMSEGGRVGIGTASPARDLQIAKSTSGGTVRLEVNNESNTSGSNGVISIYSGGTSGGDPYLHFKVDNGEQYSIGIDNDQSDALVFSNSFGVGSSNLLSIATDGAATFNDKITLGTNKEIQFVDTNESIKSDGSKMIIKSGGTTFNLPTADGTAGQALVTDGSGTLSFDSVATTVSDDGLATVKSNKHLGSTARTLDSINATFIDSAFYFFVLNDIVNETISAEMFAVTNNDTASFLGNRRGIESSGGGNVPTLATDVSNGQYRVRVTGTSADCRGSFYKVAMSSSTTDATRGNTVTSSNTDVDSASESVDTFAHATFRGAKYFISVDNDSKTEMEVVEALVVHDGTNAFISQYGHTTSGNNSLVTLTAAISGDNVVVSAAGLETNLNLTMHKILLKDNMTAQSNANQKAFAAVTVSSSATAIDLMDIDEANGAVHFIVGANASEGAYSIQEVYTAATPGVPAVANGPFVSTKGTSQLDFTAAFDTSSENSLELFASSTSGGSTTVSGYRISALAG